MIDMKPHSCAGGAMKRIALILGILSWLGFLHAVTHRSAQVEIEGLGHAAIPEVNLLNVATLACGLMALFFACPDLHGDNSSDTPWLLVAWCAFPFVGMLILLNPFSVGPALPIIPL